MMLGKKEYKDINKRTLDALFTPSDGNIPMLSDMAAVLVLLCATLGIRRIVGGLPLDIPNAVEDIIVLAVTLPLGVGVLRYISYDDDRSSSAILKPFETAGAYVEAWKAALTFSVYVVRRPMLVGFYLRAAWHTIPIILSGGLWLFGLIPYLAVGTRLVGEYENVNKSNNKNTNGETNQWTQTRANSI